jgi:hypothetical protein
VKAPGAVIVAGDISSLNATVIIVLVGTPRVGPGIVVAGTVAVTVGRVVSLGSFQCPPPPPPHPDRILIKTLIITIQAKYAFRSSNLFIKPPFEI